MTQTPKLGSNGADPVIQSPQKRYIVGSLISDPILKHCMGHPPQSSHAKEGWFGITLIDTRV